MKNFKKSLFFLIIFIFSSFQVNAAENVDYLKTDWTFKGLFGKFDRGQLQRGYQSI